MAWWKHRSGSEPMGLIAGTGQFPVLLAQAASSLDRRLVAFGVEGYTDRSVEPFCVKTHYVAMGELEKLLTLLKENRIRQVLLAGGLPKKEIYNPSVSFDGAAQGLLKGTSNKGDDHLLKAFEFFLRAKHGIRIVDSREFLKDVLAPKGVLTRRKPTPEEWQDLRFGWQIAKGIGKMDIGQTVVVKRGVVLAVEALEGTDEAVRRGGALAKEGAVVVKISKPRQDLRFDLPCVGPATVDTLRSASSKALGVESGRTLLLLKEKILEEADRSGITIVGL